MPIAAGQRLLERAVQAAIAATAVLAVLASGSLQSWISTARRLRWVALVALVGLAVAWAWQRRGRVPVAPTTVAAALVALALVSAAWSVDSRLSVERAGAFALVLAAAAALATAALDVRAVRVVAGGVVAAAAIVALGGLLVLLFRHDRAVAAATTSLPARYQGLGGGPNTATMLLAVALPVATALALAPGRTLALALVGSVALGSLSSIVACGSRGALVGGCAGLLVFAVLRERSVRRAAAAAAVVAGVFAVSFGISRLPDPAEPNAATPEVPADPAPAPFRAKPPYVDANRILRLQDDVGRPPPGVGATDDRGRQLTGSSGRVEAWKGALRQARDRPLAGYGFGTEERVFLDRYVGFNSGVPENSYVGLLLQLGAAGLAAFVALAAVLLVRARNVRLLEPARRELAAGLAGALVAGLALAFFQSYVYAAGNNATAVLWICAFLLAAVLP